MNLKKIDWKWLIALAVSVLGVVVSYYLSTAGAPAQGLTMRLISSYALQPAANSHIRDLQVVLNGTRIDNPYVSTLTLTNTGSKPVASMDFETPIFISVTSEATLVTAQIIDTTPKGIPVEIELDAGKVKIPKFLSNPNDEITFSLVTSGKPQFDPDGRIAGVSKIEYEDLTQPRARPLAAVLAGLVAAASFCLYTFYLLIGRRVFDRVMIGPWARIPAIFCFTMLGIQSLQLVGTQLPANLALGVAIMGVSCVLGVGIALGSLRVANKAANNSSARLATSTDDKGSILPP